jgi:hypothetical protein
MNKNLWLYNTVENKCTCILLHEARFLCSYTEYLRWKRIILFLITCASYISRNSLNCPFKIFVEKIPLYNLYIWNRRGNIIFGFLPGICFLKQLSDHSYLGNTEFSRFRYRKGIVRSEWGNSQPRLSKISSYSRGKKSSVFIREAPCYISWKSPFSLSLCLKIAEGCNLQC